MTESFLHYLWQNQLFDTENLVSDDGCRIEIVSAGQYNTGAGPDFFNAQLRIDGTLWAGNIEMHICSSDWKKHNHQFDPAYDSCLLHVVYKNDSITNRMNGSIIPTVEIAGRFASHLLENYLRLIGARAWIPCEPRLKEIGENLWQETIEEKIRERLDFRSDQILLSLKGNRDDWQETFYQYLSRNFGFQVNAMPFEMMARSLPFRFLLKERASLPAVEALMYGQAGMLENNFIDDYGQNLKKEYDYLRKKYSLKNISISLWKLLRLRPVNFPTVRISQFAALIHRTPVLFSEIIQSENLNSIIETLNVTASAYWDTHYRFDQESEHKIKTLGRQSIDNILINTCIPFIYCWGKYSGELELKNRALEFMSLIPPEENHLITRWKDLGVTVNNAVKSQALLQLRNQHCSEKKCLTCNIGKSLINHLSCT